MSRAHAPRRYAVTGPLDLRRTLSPLGRGPADRSLRFAPGRAWRATRTPDGPASLAITQLGDEIVVEAWGPGTDWALAAVPELLGLS
ncbi:MAG TPA: hypothetical protein VIU37_01075, partial [Candidatus Limnocylindrales bacterium]